MDNHISEYINNEEPYVPNDNVFYRGLFAQLEPVKQHHDSFDLVSWVKAGKFLVKNS